MMTNKLEKIFQHAQHDVMMTNELEKIFHQAHHGVMMTNEARKNVFNCNTFHKQL